MTTSRLLLTGGLFLTLAACTPGTPATPTATPTPAPSATASAAVAETDMEGCEHTKEGPAVAAQAIASAGPSAPVVADDHKRYDVTLVNGKGVVKFQSGAAKDYIFFANEATQLAVTDATGKAVALEASATSSPACSEIKGRFLVELDVGVYYVSLESSAAKVGLVIESSEAHDHD
jgi:hypothetical protein